MYRFRSAPRGLTPEECRTWCARSRPAWPSRTRRGAHSARAGDGGHPGLAGKIEDLVDRSPLGPSSTGHPARLPFSREVAEDMRELLNASNDFDPRAGDYLVTPHRSVDRAIRARIDERWSATGSWIGTLGTHSSKRDAVLRVLERRGVELTAEAAPDRGISRRLPGPLVRQRTGSLDASAPPPSGHLVRALRADLVGPLSPRRRAGSAGGDARSRALALLSDGLPRAGRGARAGRRGRRRGARRRPGRDRGGDARRGAREQAAQSVAGLHRAERAPARRDGEVTSLSGSPSTTSRSRNTRAGAAASAVWKRKPRQTISMTVPLDEPRSRTASGCGHGGARALWPGEDRRARARARRRGTLALALFVVNSEAPARRGGATSRSSFRSRWSSRARVESCRGRTWRTRRVTSGIRRCPISSSAIGWSMRSGMGSRWRCRRGRAR